MFVDSHVHVASADVERFPRTPTGVGSDWWRGDVSIEALLETLDANGVELAVVVQAVGVYGHDCSYAAAAVAAAPDRLALVGSIDMSLDDPAASIDAVLELGPVSGLRLFGVGSGEPTWLTDGRAAAVWERAGELELGLVVTVFADRLPLVAELATRRPDVAVAIDHCAFVDVRDARAMTTLMSLAEVPSIHLKVSSLVLSDAEAHGDAADLVDRLATSFGTSRLCWGSDHPQHQSHTYGEMLTLARTASRHLGDDDRERFLATTAHRLWWS